MNRAMKDSGIPWIGEIPKGWNTPLLKGVFREREEKTATGEETLLSLSQYTGIKPKSETEIADSHIAANYEGYKVVHRGDFVMNIMLAWNGSYAVSDYDGMISPAYCVYYFRDDSNKRYYHYLLRINGYQAAFKTLSRGIIDSRLRLYPEQFYTFPTLQPPLSEQQYIAEFLDRKCGEIDDTIALQEEFIEELKAYKQSVITEAVTRGLNPNVKFKDSGIDWIGKIPQGWDLIRLKYLCKIETGNQDTQDAVPDGVYPFYVRSPQVERSNKATFEGEGILMAGDGAGAGRVFHHAYGKYAVHQRVYRLSEIEGVFSKYLFYYISDLFGKVMDMGSAQSTVPSVRLPMLNNFAVCIPSPNEQQQIADYLNNKCIEIDSLIAIKQQKIEELKDYKKSIIYEYVTGKKEVDG